MPFFEKPRRVVHHSREVYDWKVVRKYWNLPTKSSSKLAAQTVELSKSLPHAIGSTSPSETNFVNKVETYPQNDLMLNCRCGEWKSGGTLALSAGFQRTVLICGWGLEGSCRHFKLSYSRYNTRRTCTDNQSGKYCFNAPIAVRVVSRCNRHIKQQPSHWTDKDLLPQEIWPLRLESEYLQDVEHCPFKFFAFCRDCRANYQHFNFSSIKEPYLERDLYGRSSDVHIGSQLTNVGTNLPGQATFHF